MRLFYNSWIQSKTEVFWGEIASQDHVVQIYDTDDIFLDALAGFIGSGINAGDCCLVIATEAHIEGLNERLRQHGVYIKTLIEDNRYIPLDATRLLSSFMNGDRLNEDLLAESVSAIIEGARRKNRRVRAFGEMVALLWSQGYKEATVQLEKLWDQYCRRESICLFCAYPKSGFTGIETPLVHICGAHSKIITGSASQLTDIYYQEVGSGYR